MPAPNERFADLLGRMTGAICAGNAEGAAACFTASCCELEGDLIRRYSEVFERAPVLARLGFSDQRIVESVRRWAAREG
jgi:hypothetical protein